MIKKQLYLIVALLVAICAGLSVLFLENTTKNSFGIEATYYVNGYGYKIPEDADYEIDKNGKISVKMDKDTILNIGSNPLYLSGNRTLVLPCDYMIVKPMAEQRLLEQKLSIFTEINYDELIKNVNISKNSFSKEEYKGFIYDGHNVYIFLENMEVKFDDLTFNVSPLSYAIVETNSWFQIYDFNNDLFEYGEFATTAKAQSVANDYLINMNDDTVNISGSKKMIGSNLDILNNYFNGEIE